MNIAITPAPINTRFDTASSSVEPGQQAAGRRFANRDPSEAAALELTQATLARHMCHVWRPAAHHPDMLRSPIKPRQDAPSHGSRGRLPQLDAAWHQRIEAALCANAGNVAAAARALGLLLSISRPATNRAA
jgi:hypothetical protein